MKQKRIPIIVILGHVDHGKTSLLDWIRKTRLVEKEYGGITQKINAFSTGSFTFIDTPGHELFTSLRKRGAQVADLGILVVAADDGVMPQTKESLEFLKEFKIPYVVAINKIDRPLAQPEKVKKQLSELGVVFEEWGGDVPCYLISARTGQGIDQMLEGLYLLSDLYNFSYDDEAPFFGYVLESYKDIKIGNEVLIVLKDGVLKTGQEIFSYSSYGKVKKIINTDGKELKELIPSIPAIIFGFEELPFAGEVISQNKVDILQERFFKNLVLGQGKKEIKFLIKAADYGKIEAIIGALEKIASEKEIKLKIIDASVGELVKKDVDFIKTYHPNLILFDVKIPNFLKTEIFPEPIKIIQGRSIYEINDGIYKEILQEETQEKKIGILKILKVFSQKRSKVTVGGQVEEGSFRLNDRVVIKDENNKIVAGGVIVSIEKDKISCDSVDQGLCGMVIEGSNLDKVNEGYTLHKI